MCFCDCGCGCEGVFLAACQRGVVGDDVKRQFWMKSSLEGKRDGRVPEIDSSMDIRGWK